jgi:tetratricopeptide (TPR) repeat protein
MGVESIRDKLRKRNTEALIKSGLGNVHLDLLNIDEAIRNNEEAIEIFKELEKWDEAGRVYNNLARVYEEVGEFDKAIERYELGLEHSKNGGALRMRGWTMTNLASTFIEAKQTPRALPLLKTAEEILAEFKDPIAHSKLHCMYGKYYREVGEWSKGIEHFKKSTDSLKGVNAPDYLALAEEEFGTLYQRMGEDKKARKLLEKALTWYEKKEETTRIEKIKKQLRRLG